MFETYSNLEDGRKNPEKLVKGLHQPIISETDYWLAQEKLSVKRKATSQPKEEFPLRGILKCWCGSSMTAGFSKGKINITSTIAVSNIQKPIYGDMLHSQFEELLDTLSFTEKQVNYIGKSVEAIRS